MQHTTIRRAGALDAGCLTSLMQQSSAYQGRYASIISGYEVTADYIARHQVFVAVDAGGAVLGFYTGGGAAGAGPGFRGG